MALSTFDKYFLNLPPFDKQKDFDKFWEKSIAEVKKIPLESVLVKNKKKTTHKFSVFNTSFKGFTKTKISGELLIPRRINKPRIIIYIHDYNSSHNYTQPKLDDSVGYYFITLRGHDELPAAIDEEATTPGFMIENIMDRETYYMKAVYLDIYRSIDMLRLVSDIDCSSIGIIGKGVGAAVGVFATAFSKRVKALVLDTPSYCHLQQSQNLSTGDAAIEINEFLLERKNKKKLIKDNLTYFDAMNFADKIKCPVMATVGFKDTISPPQCVFSLFNHLLSDKTIEVYPEEGNTAGGDNQFRKSVSWLIEKISS